MKKHIVARIGLTLARCSVLACTMYILWLVCYERWEKYVQNGIMQRASYRATLTPWFELALCFGPKLPEDVIIKYMEQINKQKPGTYDRHNKTLRINPSMTQLPVGYERIDEANAVKMGFVGITTVDNIMEYSEFFQKKYKWTNDVLDVISPPTTRLRRYMDSLIHQLSVGDEQIDLSVMQHTDLPLMLHYSICRNFSYDFKYPEAAGDNDFIHDISMDPETHKMLLGDGYSTYVDIFVYPRGRFTEFPLLAEYMSYRVDMREHQLLDVSGKKIEKLSRHRVRSKKTTEWVCRRHEGHSYINCISWRMMRALLDKVRCIMPMMIPYIYNTTEVLPVSHFDRSNATESIINATDASAENSTINTLTFKGAFTPEVAWPWMAKYSTLTLCTTAEQFNHTLGILIKTLYPRGKAKFPFCPDCQAVCKPDCEEYKVVLHLAGTKLIIDETKAPMIIRKPKPKDNKPADKEEDGEAAKDAKTEISTTKELEDESIDRNETTTASPVTRGQVEKPVFSNGVTLSFSTSLEVVYESWMYTSEQLFIDMSGVLSFLVGASLMALHDWTFTFFEYGMQKTRLLQKNPNRPGIFYF